VEDQTAHHCCHSEPAPHCHGGAAAPVKLGKKLRNTLIVFLLVLAASFLPQLAPLNEALLSYMGMIWWAVLLGLVIGGLIDYFVPDAFVRSLLGRGDGRSIFLAVVSGFLLSACSHGILAIAIQLYKKGAGVPSVITFLLASPWANLPITILLFSFFGWQALLIVVAAMLIAVVTGFVFLALDRAGLIEAALEAGPTDEVSWSRVTNFEFRKSFKGVWRGTVSLANMVLWWIIIGFLAAALIKAYVPHHWFMQYMGPTFTGLLITLAVATVIEICSEGSSPIAFEIFRQTGALGNPFVFLMAGVVTDYTEIGLLWTSIGKRTAIWLPVVAVPQVMLVAWLFNIYL
jgi:uncharacterized membrane protein YraQ (UPF0718 family)